MNKLLSHIRSSLLPRKKHLIPALLAVFVILYLIQVRTTLFEPWKSLPDQTPEAQTNSTGTHANTTQAKTPAQLSRSTLEVGESVQPGEVLASPSGRYRLLLDWSGDLVWSDVWRAHNVSVSDTRLNWPVQHWIRLTEEGVLELRWYNLTAPPHEGFPWSSSFIAGCEPALSRENDVQVGELIRREDGVDGNGDADTTNPDDMGDADKDEDTTNANPDPETSPPSPPSHTLELTNDGLLQIYSSSTKARCILHRPLSSTQPTGRLAILYSGPLGAYTQACATHRRHLIDPWLALPSSSVDIHIFTYLEETPPIQDPVTGNMRPPSESEIESTLQSCLGPSIKTVTILSQKAVEEEWRDPEPSRQLLHFCRGGGARKKLHRQLNRLKDTYMVAKQARRYMMLNGVVYDYMLTSHLDVGLGKTPPFLQAEAAPVPESGVLFPSPIRKTEVQVPYALLHDGTVRQGVSDLQAFGRPVGMFAYMDLYREIRWLMEMEMVDGVENMPVGTKQQPGTEAMTAEHCSLENHLVYWLAMNGVDVVTAWDWDVDLVREKM